MYQMCSFCRPVSVRLATLKDLLEAKADPNIADNSGRTALSWAVSNPNGKSLLHIAFNFVIGQTRSVVQITCRSVKSGSVGIKTTCVIGLGIHYRNNSNLSSLPRPRATVTW